MFADLKVLQWEDKGKQSPNGFQMFHSSLFNVQLVKTKTKKKFVKNYTFVIL